MTDKNDVRRGKDILFADGEVRWIKPLTITRLRKFVVLLNAMDNSDDAMGMSDEELDDMLKATALIVEKDYPHLVERDKEGNVTNLEALGDVVDLPTFQECMAVAMGQSDPNE
jgi:hypothetical protein